MNTLYMCSDPPQIWWRCDQVSGICSLQEPGCWLVCPLPTVQELQSILLQRVHQGAGHWAETEAQEVQISRICRYILTPTFLSSVMHFFLLTRLTLNGRKVASILILKVTEPCAVTTWDWAHSRARTRPRTGWSTCSRAGTWTPRSNRGRWSS